MGDEEAGPERKISKSEELLNKLNKRALQRKRERLSLEAAIPSPDQVIDESELEKDSQERTTADIQTEKDTSFSTDDTPVKKKRKRKHSDCNDSSIAGSASVVDNDNQISQSPASCLGQQKKIKKTKKAKKEGSPLKSQTLSPNKEVIKVVSEKTVKDKLSFTENERTDKKEESVLANELTVTEGPSNQTSEKTEKDKLPHKAKKNLKHNKHDKKDESVHTSEKAIKEDEVVRQRASENSSGETVNTENLSEDEAADTSSNHKMIEEERDEQTRGQRKFQNEIGGFTILGNVAKKQATKVRRVLPDWLASPSVITSDIRNRKTPLEQITVLDEDLVSRLRENGVHSLFPVQADVIPAILDSVNTGLTIGRAGYRPSDICVSAPTGSGKTLTFVLPIVQALRHRVACHVRALVVLPVRDLASQVYSVFRAYCTGTPLKVGLVIGQKTFSSEQTALVKKSIRGHHSLVDIIVATPGRLVDHILKTPGFSFDHLRFLVIDEADRMMDEIKQDWLMQVQKAVYQNGRPQPGLLTANSASRMEMPLQKLLFSATLSQNPEKLQQLALFQPKLFTSVVKDTRLDPDSDSEEEPDNANGNLPKADAVMKETINTKETVKVVKGDFVGKYTTPSGLTEFMIESDNARKPLIMLYLLHHLKFKHVLCFTNTTEATHRLYWLVKLVGGIEVREFSANLHALKRARLIKQFAAGKIDLLVCTDAMARGMDIDNVQYVISYDRPAFIKTYIHRVGRTARAGKVGTALTLLEKREIFNFKKMMKEAGKEGIKEMKLRNSDLKPLVEVYQDALKQLPDILKNEKYKSKRHW